MFLDKSTISPKAAYLKDCKICGSSPQVLRTEKNDMSEAWAFVCPSCGFQIVGRRCEEYALDGINLVDVTKAGDDFDTMVMLWNAEEPRKAA
jgi:predicted RNA-binding Zn-ribbon protein involved in translation (DUF1610 family)